MNGKDLIKQMRALLAQEIDADVRAMSKEELSARLEDRARALSEGGGSGLAGTEGRSPLFAHMTNDQVKARLRAKTKELTGSATVAPLFRTYSPETGGRNAAPKPREPEDPPTGEAGGLLDARGGA